MKKAIVLLIACALLLCGCATNVAAGGDLQLQPVETDEAPVSAEPTAPIDVIEIREKLFVAQTNEIYLNADDYMGKTIKYEGLMDVFFYPENGQTYYSVIRYGPGCCGNDGNVGFEIFWDGEYPAKDEWVEVVGVLEEYEEDGYFYVRLAVTSLEVLEVRGLENVEQ